MMTLAAVLCCILTLHAQPISEQQAMERALQYMNSGKASANARRMVADNRRKQRRRGHDHLERPAELPEHAGGYGKGRA